MCECVCVCVCVCGCVCVCVCVCEDIAAHNVLVCVVRESKGTNTTTPQVPSTTQMIYISTQSDNGNTFANAVAASPKFFSGFNFFISSFFTQSDKDLVRTQRDLVRTKRALLLRITAT